MGSHLLSAQVVPSESINQPGEHLTSGERAHLCWNKPLGACIADWLEGLQRSVNVALGLLDMQIVTVLDNTESARISGFVVLLDQILHGSERLNGIGSNRG